jgi:hypothetical protein
MNKQVEQSSIIRAFRKEPRESLRYIAVLDPSPPDGYAKEKWGQFQSGRDGRMSVKT